MGGGVAIVACPARVRYPRPILRGVPSYGRNHFLEFDPVLVEDVRLFEDDVPNCASGFVRFIGERDCDRGYGQIFYDSVGPIYGI